MVPSRKIGAFFRAPSGGRAACGRRNPNRRVSVRYNGVVKRRALIALLVATIAAGAATAQGLSRLSTIPVLGFGVSRSIGAYVELGVAVGLHDHQGAALFTGGYLGGAAGRRGWRVNGGLRAMGVALFFPYNSQLTLRYGESDDAPFVGAAVQTMGAELGVDYRLAVAADAPDGAVERPVRLEVGAAVSTGPVTTVTEERVWRLFD